jgi:hypothetical protein
VTVSKKSKHEKYWPDKDQNKIQLARNRYDAGLCELAQKRDDHLVYLVEKARKVKIDREPYFSRVLV